jgi:AraC family transcriptional activator of tynA and feaB
MQPAPMSPIRTWSTDDASPGQRLGYWVDSICEGFLEMSVQSERQVDFSGRLVSAPCGPIGVNRVYGSAQDVYRTPGAISRSKDNYFYLLSKTDLPWTAVQAGRSVPMQPNDLVLIDSRRCYEFHFPMTADSISLQLPPEWLRSWLVDPADQVARRIDGQSGWGSTLSSFVRQLSPEATVASPLPTALLSDQLGVLLGLATGAAATTKTTREGGAAESLHARIVDAIRQRHAEPGLTASDLAAQLAMSPRTVHRAMANRGMTFAQQLMACRMSAARRMLDDARFDRLSLAEIGRRAGLADASHFTRLCRRHLGMTPAALRLDNR